MPNSLHSVLGDHCLHSLRVYVLLPDEMRTKTSEISTQIEKHMEGYWE